MSTEVCSEKHLDNLPPGALFVFRFSDRLGSTYHLRVLERAFHLLISASFVHASLESQMSGQSFPMNLNEQVIAPLFSNIAVVGLFLIPLISMRLFAEEKRQGTIELLITSPVHDMEIIIGKWLSAVLMYGALLLVLFIDFSFLFIYGNPDWKPIATGFLGILLQGACLLALGTFISTLTRNQIVAGALGFALALVLWILNWTTSFGNSDTVQVLNYVSIVSHMDSFSRGVIDSEGLRLLPVYDLFWIVSNLSIPRVVAVEGVMADTTSTEIASTPAVPEAPPPVKPKDTVAARQARYGATAVLYTIVVLAALVLVNWLANRYNKTVDTTSNKRFTLSQETQKIVKNLKTDATITYIDKASGFDQAKGMLDRYRNLSPKIHIQYIDYMKQPTLARSYGVRFPGTAYVEIGPRREEAKAADRRRNHGRVRERPEGRA